MKTKTKKQKSFSQRETFVLSSCGMVSWPCYILPGFMFCFRGVLSLASVTLIYNASLDSLHFRHLFFLSGYYSNLFSLATENRDCRYTTFLSSLFLANSKFKEIVRHPECLPGWSAMKWSLGPHPNPSSSLAILWELFLHVLFHFTAAEAHCGFL